MRKATFCLLLVVLLLSGCTEKETLSTSETISPTAVSTEDTTASTEISSTIPPHQDLSALTGELDPEKDIRISLPQVGLRNVLILSASNMVRLNEDVWGKVFLLGDDRHGHGDDCYLAVIAQDKVYAYDCAMWDNMSAMGAMLELRDFDGDGYSEILLQQAVDCFGGAGQYVSRVFKFKNNSFETIFCSMVDKKLIDTGFSLQILENESYQITNSDVGYQETFSVREEDRESLLPYMYDEDGDPELEQLWVDSFFEFKSADVNNDGIYEIVGKQYSCLSYHSNWLGDCCTVWSYSKDTEAFEIVDAWFEPKN